MITKTTIMKFTQLVLLSLFAINFQMCSLKSNKELKVDLNKGIEAIIEKYKADLKTESISITPLAINDSVDFVHIVIIEPQNIPVHDDKINILSMELAKNVYKFLHNKNNFTGIKVEIAFKEEYFCDSYRRIISNFSYDQLALALNDN